MLRGMPFHSASCGGFSGKAVAVLMAAAIAFPAVAEPIRESRNVAPRSQPAGKTAVPMPSRSVLDPGLCAQIDEPRAVFGHLGVPRGCQRRGEERIGISRPPR